MLHILCPMLCAGTFVTYTKGLVKLAPEGKSLNFNCLCFIPLYQCFSTFFSSRHTKPEKKFGGTLILDFFGKRPRKSDKLPTKSLNCPQKCNKSNEKNLAAHLEGAHGTLVCRGTPVEKHCHRG